MLVSQLQRTATPFRRAIYIMQVEFRFRPANPSGASRCPARSRLTPQRVGIILVCGVARDPPPVHVHAPGPSRASVRAASAIDPQRGPDAP
jgi:hypothetical protein